LDHNEGHGGFALKKDLLMEDVMKRIEERKNNVVGKDVKNYFVDLLSK
jgi:hypothetical protein